MNNTLSTLLLFSVLLFQSCNKTEEPKPIDPLLQPNYSVSYENSGVNLLALTDSSTIVAGDYYTLSVQLGKDAKIKVVLTNLSTTDALWLYALNNHWTVGPYNQGVQEFSTTRDGLSIMTLQFLQGVGVNGGPGSCRIDIYENSEEITASKVVFW